MKILKLWVRVDILNADIQDKPQDPPTTGSRSQTPSNALTGRLVASQNSTCHRLRSGSSCLLGKPPVCSWVAGNGRSPQNLRQLNVSFSN